MALVENDRRVSYAGNGVTTAFTVDFKFFANADLKVVLKVDSTGVETLKTITTHYTVTGAGEDAGGTVTMLTAPATGETLTLYGDPAISTGLDLRENDALPAESVEEQIDKIAAMIQRQKDRIDRAVRLTDGDASGFDPKLPQDFAAEAADKVPLINSAGTGFADAADWPTADDIADAEENATAAAASATAAATSASSASTSATSATASAAAAAASALVAAGNYTVDRFNGDGATVAFTLTATPASENNTLVFVSGVYQQKDTYSVAGTTLTFSAAPPVGTGNIEVHTGTSYSMGVPSDGTVTKAKLASGALSGDVVAVTTTITLTSSHDVVLASSAGGAYTITLPAAASNADKIMEIKKTTADFAAITIDGNGAETIDGSATTSINTQYESIKIVSDGSNWHILNRYINGAWESFTPTGTATTNTTYTGMRRRVADSWHFRVHIQYSGTNTQATVNDFRVNIPNSLTIDTAKLPDTNYNNRLGHFQIRDASAGNYASFMGSVAYNTTSTVILMAMDEAAASNHFQPFVNNSTNTPITIDNLDFFELDFIVPISGWKG